MGCGFYKVPGIGTVHINFGSGRRAPRPCVHCGDMSTKLCDHRLAVDPRGPSQATCDAPICDGCALSVPGKNRDYCKHHAKHHRAEVPSLLPFGQPEEAP